MTPSYIPLLTAVDFPSHFLKQGLIGKANRIPLFQIQMGPDHFQNGVFQPVEHRSTFLQVRKACFAGCIICSEFCFELKKEKMLFNCANRKFAKFKNENR
jgi:hypothetical protein